MTQPRILVLTSSTGLNTNLLKLAFSPWNHETHFSRTSEWLDETMARKSNLNDVKWVVIDQGKEENLTELQQLLKTNLPQASGVFLTEQNLEVEAPSVQTNFHFLQKPFEPSELKKYFK